MQVILDRDLDGRSVGVRFVRQIVGQQTECLGLALDGRGFGRFLGCQFGEVLFPAVLPFLANPNVKGASLCRFRSATNSQSFTSPAITRFVTEIDSDGHRFEPPASLCKAMQLAQKMWHAVASA